MNETDLKKLGAGALDEVAKAGLDNLEDVKVKYLGRKGAVTEILKSLGSLSAEDRPVIGGLANIVRKQVEEAVELRQPGSRKSRYRAPPARRGNRYFAAGPQGPRRSAPCAV